MSRQRIQKTMNVDGTQQFDDGAHRTKVVTVLLLVCAGLLWMRAVNAEPVKYRFVDVRTMSGPCCTDQGNDLVVDEEGSVLIAGSRGSLDVDYDGVIDLPTFGRPDALIAKVNLVGDENTGWTRGPGGPKMDRADGIASDRDGGVYAVGAFTEHLQMTETTILQSAGGGDGFLGRYGRDSKLMWGRAIGGIGEDGFYDVASDSDGNVIMIGTVVGSVDVNRDGNIDLDAGKDGQALVVSFSPNGEFRWMRASGGNASARGMAVTIGPNDDIYIAGWYRNGAPDFTGDGEPDLPVSEETSPDVVALNDPGKYEFNGFYARLDKDGSPIWVKSVAGPGLQMAASLAIAATGDLLVLGGYTAPPDFDGDGDSDLEFRSRADRVWKYDIDGNVFLMQVTPDGERVWAKRFTSPARHVTARGGRIALSGAYSSVLDVDDDGVPERESDGDEEREGFTAILDADGELQQVITVVGDHNDIVNAAGFSPDGNTLYLTGYTSLGADFDGDDKIEAASVCHKAGEVYLAVYALEDQN